MWGKRKTKGFFINVMDGYLVCMCVCPLTNDIFAPDAAFFFVNEAAVFFLWSVKAKCKLPHINKYLNRQRRVEKHLMAKTFYKERVDESKSNTRRVSKVMFEWESVCHMSLQKNWMVLRINRETILCRIGLV